MTFDTTGTQQNWITDGFTLAMAANVLCFGAIGDRYGRKKLFLLGAILSVPIAFLSAIAWSAEKTDNWTHLIRICFGIAIPDNPFANQRNLGGWSRSN
jgi:DHA2 family multidrug resistance protein-like MFS transporter